MLEPWRSHYLASLGVTQYVAKGQLVGAAPSFAPGWDASASVPSAADTVLPAASSDTTVVDKRDREPVPRPAIYEILSAREEPSAHTDQASSPEKTTAAPAIAAKGESAPYRLLFAVLGGRLLIVDDVGTSQSKMGMYQQLLRNIGRAFGAEVGAFELFRWPLVEHPQLATNSQAGRDAALGRLMRHIEDSSVKRVLLLGNAVEQLDPTALRSTADAIASSSTAHSLSRCIEDVEAKRSLWMVLKQLTDDE